MTEILILEISYASKEFGDNYSYMRRHKIEGGWISLHGNLNKQVFEKQLPISTKTAMSPKRIAVIGGGPCGLCTVKCLKEEGHEPICFERTSHIGGLWRYHDDDVDGLASVMKTTIINSSKEMSAVSDFPPDVDAPNYMHNKLVHHYLVKYAERFDVTRHVQLNKQVVQVDLADDYEKTGRLTVEVRDTKSGQVSKDVYDGVTVCIGHHVYPNIPEFPGMDKFKGKVMHSHSLKSVEEFENKVVVVVGVGNSGMDASVEISSVANQVYLSTRRGTWVLPRVGPSGIPLDVALGRRFLDLLFKILPYSINCWVSEKMLNDRFDHELYDLKPKHRVWSQHPTVSDTLPIKLLSGTVKVRKNIKEFTESGVIFDKEDQVTECDAIVLATGYKIKFPFLSESITAIKDNQVHLYKYVFPPHMKHPTLAILGLIQSVGAGFPVGEAQARWTSMIFSDKVSLPSKEEMEADILKKKEVNKKRYTNSQRHTIQVDYIEYLDEISDLFGAKPNLIKILFTDPALFMKMFFGPSVPYQYRLQGPHAWSGARQAIMDCEKRIKIPLKRDFKQKESSFNQIYAVAFLLVLFAVFLYSACC